MIPRSNPMSILNKAPILHTDVEGSPDADTFGCVKA